MSSGLSAAWTHHNQNAVDRPAARKPDRGHELADGGVSQISEAMSSLNDGVRQAGALLRQVSDSRSQMREAMVSLEAEISKFKLGERR